MDYDKMEKFVVDSIERTIQGIENQELSNEEKVEFFNIYEREIIGMLETKIELFKKEIEFRKQEKAKAEEQKEE